MGKGHILFFVDKPRYTLNRYIQIYRECIRRGFDVQSYVGNWDCYPDHLFDRMVRSTNTSKELLVERITLRIKESPKEFFHYYGKQISKRKAINLLK